MRYAVLFKTHLWDDYSRRQLDRLRSICRLGTIFIFKDQTKSFESVDASEQVINASEGQCHALGLPLNPPMNLFWYNNDFPLYFLFSRQAEFDYYVSIEYDVGCSVDLDDLIQRCQKDGLDCLAEPIRTPISEWHWASTGRDVYGADEPLHHSLFCFAVFSKRAVATLYKRRQEIGTRLHAGAISAWPYGELFMATEIANAGLSTRSLGAFCDVSRYDWWPPILERGFVELTAPALAHPALDERRYIGSLLKFETDLSAYFDPASVLRNRLDLCDRDIYVPLLFAELRKRRLSHLITRLQTEVAESDRERLHAHFNVARGKRATQSSLSPWSKIADIHADAMGAVNGTITGGYGFHTGEDETPWWMVDLETVQAITEVRLFNRLDVRHRARNVSIWFSRSLSEWQQVYKRREVTDFGGADGQPLCVIFATPQPARFVRVQLDERSLLHLDEVQVFGDPA